jgi:hypothetical protein
MVCWHQRADLGDRTVSIPEGPEDYNALVAEFGRNAIVVPLWLYEHSGMTMRAAATRPGYPFDCPWDAGQVGFIAVSLAKVREEWSVKRVSAELREKVRQGLVSEVEEYDRYLRGDVYGIIVKDADNEDFPEGVATKLLGDESCWGFIGFEYACEEGKRMAESCAEEIAAEQTEASYWAARDLVTV